MADMSAWQLNKEQIMSIANRKGWFSVPKYSYRASNMRKKCHQLVVEGKLRKDNERSTGRDIVFIPV